jgi:hypothetical protein
MKNAGETFADWFVRPLIVVILGGVAVWGITHLGSGSGQNPQPTQAAPPDVPSSGATLPVEAPSQPTLSIAPGTVLYQADWLAGFGGWTGSGDWHWLNGMVVNDGTYSTNYDDDNITLTPPIAWTRPLTTPSRCRFN